MKGVLDGPIASEEDIIATISESERDKPKTRGRPSERALSPFVERRVESRVPAVPATNSRRLEID